MKTTNNTPKMTASEKKHIVKRLDSLARDAHHDLCDAARTDGRVRIDWIRDRINSLLEDPYANPRPAPAAAVRKVIAATIEENRSNLGGYVANIPVLNLITNDHQEEITRLSKEKKALRKVQAKLEARLQATEDRISKEVERAKDLIMVGAAGLECVEALASTIQKELQAAL